MTANVCVVCENPKKYCCPQCRVFYCSVPCAKAHNCVPIQKEAKESVPATVSAEADAEDEIPKTPDFEALRNSTEIRELLRNNNLKETLRLIRNSSDPPASLHAALRNSEFQKFAEACLNMDESEAKHALATTSAADPIELFQGLLEEQLSPSP